MTKRKRLTLTDWIENGSFYPERIWTEIQRGKFMKGSIRAYKAQSCVCGGRFRAQKMPYLKKVSIPICEKCGETATRFSVRKTIPDFEGKGITRDFNFYEAIERDSKGNVIKVTEKPFTEIEQCVKFIATINESLLDRSYNPLKYDHQTKHLLKFGEFLEAYLKQQEKRAQKKPGEDGYLAPASFRKKQSLIRNHIKGAFDSIDIDQISFEQIEDFALSIDMERTRNLVLGELKFIFNCAKRPPFRLLKVIPDFPKIKSAKKISSRDIPTEAQQIEIIKALPEPWYSMCVLAAPNSLRPSEMLTLRKKSFRLDEGYMIIDNHFSDRVAIPGRKSQGLDDEHGIIFQPLDEYQISIITPYVEKVENDDDFVFTTKHGKPFCYQTFWKAWNKACMESVGRHFKPYTGLKHSTLSTLRQKHGNIESAQSLSELSSAHVVGRYAQLTSMAKLENKRKLVNSSLLKRPSQGTVRVRGA